MHTPNAWMQDFKQPSNYHATQEMTISSLGEQYAFPAPSYNLTVAHLYLNPSLTEITMTLPKNPNQVVEIAIRLSICVFAHRARFTWWNIFRMALHLWHTM